MSFLTPYLNINEKKIPFPSRNKTKHLLLDLKCATEKCTSSIPLTKCPKDNWNAWRSFMCTKIARLMSQCLRNAPKNDMAAWSFPARRLTVQTQTCTCKEKTEPEDVSLSGVTCMTDAVVTLDMPHISRLHLVIFLPNWRIPPSELLSKSIQNKKLQ